MLYSYEAGFGVLYRHEKLKGIFKERILHNGGMKTLVTRMKLTNYVRGLFIHMTLTNFEFIKISR